MSTAQPGTPQLGDVVAAASGVLGRELTTPVILTSGSGRSLVLRCEDRRSSATVIVKAYPQSANGAQCFAAEAAGLAFATATGLAPAFLGADADALTVVMSDLGTGASMADVLLANSSAPGGTGVFGGGAGADSVSAAAADSVSAAATARSTLLNWAAACGSLSASTSRRRGEFDALLEKYSAGRASESYLTRLPAFIRGVADRAALLGVAARAGLDSDLEEVAASLESDQHVIFSPGDICPDNNMLTPAGVRFLDFEEAGFYSVFLDAAYIRMPFSTCWCVFSLPSELSREVEAAYRAQICLLWPELSDDAHWQPGVRHAVAAWTLSSMGWLLEWSLKGDTPMEPGATSPRTRQLLRHRWKVLAGELESAGELPFLAGLMRDLLAATEHWEAPELPVYPAFR
jgi:hypothetical protein